MEYCLICCDEKNTENFYTCNTCKFSNCIDCHKTYLLGVTQDAHCLKAGCRTVIPFDIFLAKFGQKWIFGKYKEHRHKILWEREMALMPATVEMAAQTKKLTAKENLIKDLRNQIRQIEIDLLFPSILTSKYNMLFINKKNLKTQLKKELREEYDLRNDLNRLRYGWDDRTNKKNEKSKYIYKYRCPIDNCKGYLDEKNICLLCENNICMSCYSFKEKNGHICNQEKVETFKAIKKEAKPCPSCGEFISKISGCDQMFCIGCGTAFSWNTGEIERGVIHNPHAHTFFQNNPQAHEAYQRNRNNGGAAAGAAAGGDGCRNYMPEVHFFYRLKDGFYSALELNGYIIKGPDLKQKLLDFHQYIIEFRQYRYRDMSRYITTPLNTNNRDIRIKYLNNEYDDRKLNIYLHKNDKAEFFNKQLFNMMITTYEIAEFIFWTFYDEIDQSPTGQIEKCAIIHKYITLLNNLIIDTNKNVKVLCDQFGYVYHDGIHHNFEFNNYFITIR